MNTRELVCGGRLMKRLRSELEYLSCGYLDEERDRAFIGTSGGDLFILDISKNPPNFLHTVDLVQKPLSAISVTKDSILVAHFDTVSVLSLEKKGEERRTTKLGGHRAKHLHGSEVSILSVTTSPDRGLVFGGYSDGSVAVWSARESEAVIIFQAHQCDVTQLVWLEDPPWGPMLYTGGGDGKVTTWKLVGKPEDYVLWAPASGCGPSLLDRLPAPRVVGASTEKADLGSDALAAFDPTFEPTFGGGPSDVFAMDKRRVNPQALKSAEDSDSDNDIVDAFH